jgi:putative molybdopterin biosynthesis protein
MRHSSPRLKNDLRTRRRLLDLTQEELAARVGVTRQALSIIEQGRSSPSTTVALRLARALRCQVEDLFSIDDAFEPIPVTLTSSPPAPEATAILGRVDSNWVAHPLRLEDQILRSLQGDGALTPAGTAQKGWFATPFTNPDELANNVLIAGCAPALAALEHHTSRHAHGRARWLPCPSLRALDLLARHQVHIAGLHVRDSTGSDFNTELVRKTFSPGTVEMLTLATWRAGLIVAPGNPLGIGGIEDLFRPDLRFATREEGSGALITLHQCLRDAGLDPGALSPAACMSSHIEVALATRYGVVDVGIAVETVALGLGLEFLPLSEERFDLVFPANAIDDGSLSPLLDTLTSGPFRNYLAASPGYDVTLTGSTVEL